MNKKNISITISTFIAAFVVSILAYILVTQNLEIYNEARESMPEDITLYSKVDKEKIDKIKKLKNIKTIGLRGEERSLKSSKNIFTLKSYDSNYFSMQKNLLTKGDFPKDNREILISEITSKDLGLNIGDTCIFEKGKRLLKNKELEPSSGYNKNESFESLEKIEYKITGIYNSNSESKIQKIYSTIGNEKVFYPAIKLKNLAKIFETKLDIEKVVGKKNYTILNEQAIRLLSIDENGFNPFKFFIRILLMPLILINIFTFMIKNVFNIWGIYKIKEFSMYKSIGATNFQIYKLLFKEIFKISLVPMVLGQVCGLSLVMMVYNRLFYLHEVVSGKNLGRFSFNWQSIIIINIVLFLILFVSTTFPTRIISKVEILDGLKENIQTKNLKKIRHKNLFKELLLNNRKSTRPAIIVMTAGLSLIIFLFGIKSMHDYNTARSKVDMDFNMIVRYSAEDNKYPEILDHIKEEFNPEKSIVSIRKNYYIDTSNLIYSDEFNKIGYSKGFDGIFYYSDQDLVFGSLTGIDDERFSKISENKSDIVLINLVQEDPKSFYSEANFIPYLNENIKSINIKELEDFSGKRLEINKFAGEFFEDQDFLSLYDINLVTSLENFKTIIDSSKEEFKKRGMEFPRIYYELEMKFDEENLAAYKSRIENIMEDSVSSGEKYSVKDIITIEKSKKINNQGMYFLGIIMIVAIVFLNVANSYSSTNLTFFNRKREIGILLSNGMHLGNLENMLLKNFGKSILLSIILSIILGVGALALLFYSIPYLSLSKYISMFPFIFTTFLIVFVASTSYFIYNVTMKKITRKDIITLLRV